MMKVLSFAFFLLGISLVSPAMAHGDELYY